MSAAIYVQHYQQFFDNDGNPLAGGKLYTYDAGTTTPRPTYTNPSASVAHPNPIILDAAGKPETGPIFIQGTYRFELYDADDAPVSGGTVDNISQYLTAKDIEDALINGYRYLSQEIITADVASFTWASAPADAVAMRVICVGSGGAGGATDGTGKQNGEDTSFGSLVIGEGGEGGDTLGDVTPNDGRGGAGGEGTGDLVIRGDGGGGASRGTGTDILAGKGGGSKLGGGAPGWAGSSVLGLVGYGGGSSGLVQAGKSSAGGGGGGYARSFVTKAALPNLDVAINVGASVGGSGAGVVIIEYYGTGAINYTNLGPSAPGFGGGGIIWDKSAGLAPVTQYINGVKVEKFNQFDSQEIYAVVTVPDFHEAGNPITLKFAKFACDVDAGNVFFKAQSWLLRGDLTNLGSLGTPYDSTNTESTAPAVIDELEDIGDIDITNGAGVLQSQQVQGGDRILVKIYRDVANETVSAAGDAKLVIGSFELNLGA